MAEFPESLADIAAQALADCDGYGDVDEARDNAVDVAVAVLRALAAYAKPRRNYTVLTHGQLTAYADELEGIDV